MDSKNLSNFNVFEKYSFLEKESDFLKTQFSHNQTIVKNLEYENEQLKEINKELEKKSNLFKSNLIHEENRLMEYVAKNEHLMRIITNFKENTLGLEEIVLDSPGQVPQ